MAIFDNRVMDLIVENEGLYSNDPNDPGGETKYGISKASYPDFDIKSLTVDQAYDIYSHDFWGHYNLNMVKSQSVANKVLLALINMNPVDAIKGLQRAVNDAGYYQLNVDGILGLDTFKYVNIISWDIVLECLKLEYVKIYYNRVVENRKKEKYLLGWIRRALL